ncbi:MAG: PorP/SprF family type IX secretion system membrane protein [Bacteroidia bacterium]
MKTLKTITFIIGSTLGGLTLQAQQDPMYTHYMDNTLIVNPAYAGSRDALTVTALYRSQWVDFKGAPVNQTITMHAPLQNQHIGLGLAISNDKIGPINNSSIVGDFAYRMNLSKKSTLALGLSAGINIFQANLSALQLNQQSDPTFQNNINNHITPNVGFGAYYYREHFYAGISSSNLLQNNYSVINHTNGVALIGQQQRSYYLIAGALFNLGNALAFKPTTLVKVTAAAPIEVDVTASFIIMKRLLLGAMYRTGDAVGALVGFYATPQFYLGYSYDFSYGLKTPLYNMGSHEIILRYDFLRFDKKQVHTPRYF